MIVKNIVKVFLLSCIFLFCACNNDVLLNTSYDTPLPAWSSDDALSYKAYVKDTLASYKCIINIRYDKDFPYMNAFFFVNTYTPDGEMLSDTIECNLFNDEGKPLGRGYGKYKSIQYLVQSNLRFHKTGEYSFEIFQGMRTDSLSGIKSIGLKICK